MFVFLIFFISSPIVMIISRQIPSKGGLTGDSQTGPAQMQIQTS